jgi:lipid-A-disaccharide synthase
MLEAAAALGREYEYLLPVASTLNAAWLEEEIGNAQRIRPRLVEDAREALFHARASVVASGTATVQAAVIGNPFVVVYRVSPVTFRLAKYLVDYPREVWPSRLPDVHGNLPIAMVNLIAGRTIVPELIQDQFTAARVADSLDPLLGDTPERTRMIVDLTSVREKLLPPQMSGSIAQVCDAVEVLAGARLNEAESRQ